MTNFAIDFLDDYTDESLLEELRRVAVLHDGHILSKKLFNRLSGKVSASTIARRFGGWKQALELAGVATLYGGQVVSEKMRSQLSRRLTNDELIAEMQRVRSVSGMPHLTVANFNHTSTVAASGTIRRRFGTWKAALEIAGIPQSELAIKAWTDEQCFKNLANTWAALGRLPTYLDMGVPPSLIKSKPYVTRWGTWRQALKAFVEWSRLEDDDGLKITRLREPSPVAAARPQIRRSAEDCRQVGDRLRFRVFHRDRFRCVACGRSPATDLATVLHADHITPVALGGKTTLGNLQTLCGGCNLGKGTMPG
jgi:hypothetical protein